MPRRFRLASTACTIYLREAPLWFGQPPWPPANLVARIHLSRLGAISRPTTSLRLAGVVDVGSVEEIDALLESASGDLAGNGFVGLAAEHHGAKAKGRDQNAAAAQLTIFHIFHFKDDRCEGRRLRSRPAPLRDWHRRHLGEQGGAQGPPSRAVARLGIDGEVGDQLAFLQHHDAVGQLDGLLHVMGDQQHGRAGGAGTAGGAGRACAGASGHPGR